MLQVNFAYKEAGEQKQALVKLRLCPKHALQLNHKQNHKLIKKRKREQEEQDPQSQSEKTNDKAGKAHTSAGDISGGDRASEDDLDATRDARHSKRCDKAKRDTSANVFEGLFN